MQNKNKSIPYQGTQHRTPGLHQNHTAPYPSSMQGESTNGIVSSRLTGESWLPKTFLCKESCCLLTLVWLLQKLLLKPNRRKRREKSLSYSCTTCPRKTLLSLSPGPLQPAQGAQGLHPACSQDTRVQLPHFCGLKNKPEINNPHPPRHRFPLAQKSAVPSANFHATIPTIILAANLTGQKKSPRSLTSTFSTRTFKHSWNSQSPS